MALFRSITEAEWVYVRDDMFKGLKMFYRQLALPVLPVDL
jgi:hypothetical protein